MTTTDRLPTAGETEYQRVLADVLRRLDELEASVEAQSAALTDEVRTRRLVIDDHEGNERVIVGEPYARQFGIAVNFKPEDTDYGHLSLSEASFTLGESPSYGETISGELSFIIDEHTTVALHTAKLDSGAIRSDIDVETFEVSA